MTQTSHTTRVTPQSQRELMLRCVQLDEPVIRCTTPEGRTYDCRPESGVEDGLWVWYCEVLGYAHVCTEESIRNLMVDCWPDVRVIEESESLWKASKD